MKDLTGIVYSFEDMIQGNSLYADQTGYLRKTMAVFFAGILTRILCARIKDFRYP